MDIYKEFEKNIDPNNSVFQLATDFVNQTAQHIFLTGKAGTGKTTFLKHIRNATHKNCIVAAPTGVAAINAGGMTLHSLFQLPFEPFIPGGSFHSSRERFRFSTAKRDMLKGVELLIIDEVSMLRADTLDCIDSLLRYIRRNEKPFGGVQMLYIGDMFQLPPVVKEDEWEFLRDYYQSLFFFHSKAVQRMPPVYLELKKIYRQRQQDFVDLLNRVRNDELTADDLQTLNRQYHPNFQPPAGEKYITLTTRNAKADAINNQELGSLKTPSFRFEGEIKGEFPEYALPTEMTLTLKKNTQIMFIKNDTGEERRYFNGKLGVITDLSTDRIDVRLAGSGRVITLEKEVWKNVKYTLNKETAEIEEEELGSFEQYPIRLAWAITIHKSQGLTFERAIIDTGDAFAAGQSYVALSRCTSLEGIVLLSKITHRSVQTDLHAIQLSKSEKEEYILQNELEEGKKRFWAERLLLYFDCSELLEIPRELKKLLEDKHSEEYDFAHKLARDMTKQAYEIREVAMKFQNQLKNIVSKQTDDEISLLRERCNKAVTYFHNTIIEKMLIPLQYYINVFKVKKAKTFFKHLCNLELDIKLFIENMKKVRYNDVLLVKDLVLSIPERNDLLKKIEPEKPSAPKPVPASASVHFQGKKKAKPAPSTSAQPQISSARQSLNMLRDGRTIPEIAEDRNLVQSTIETHLAEFVFSGELPVTEVISQQTLDELTPFVLAAIAEDNMHLAPIRDAAGKKYSFSEIRLVMKHCLHEMGEV